MDHYGIFKECFPLLPLDRKSFDELLQIKDCRIFESEGGFAAVKGNELRLLCVPPHIRGKGIGSRLLKRAEEHILSVGYDETVAGGFSSHLFIGVPVSREEFMKNKCCFFEKNGYSSDGGAAEMKLELDGFSADSFDIPVPENAYFGEYKGSLSDLHRAVDKVEPEWTQYFDNVNVFCGYLDGEIASFCITDDDECCLLSGGKGKIGSVGCVGTVPEYRRRGIGLKMVALAAQELKEKGCASCFIHYTGVYDWYAKIGAETFLWELFYKKTLIDA